MARTDAFFSAVEARRSLYKLTNTSPLSDTQIQDIVVFALKHTPSAFNVQSARAVILVGDQHQKLWDMGDAVLKAEMPEPVYTALAPKVAGLRAAYGSVLWFEDEASLDVLRQKNAGIQHVITEWSDHSSGMHQFVAWTALELEGLGCNLQHYNYSPKFTQDVLENWDLPKTWTLKSQLVFGTPSGGPDKVKTFTPVEPRVKLFAAVNQ